VSAIAEPERRIESATSRTAEWTCVSRAVSSLERDPHLRCDDYLARELLPGFMQLLLAVAPVRLLYKKLAPPGALPYVVARTKYIDAVFRRALEQRFFQVLIFGAGFDTRALRFAGQLQSTRIFELDVPATQNAKIAQYRKRGLSVPPNLVFIPIDFDRESLRDKLEGSGFQVGERSLFLLEGVLMYLQPESVDATFRVLTDYSGEGSRLAFDYAYSSVLRGNGDDYGAKELQAQVSRAGEAWHFGLKAGEVTGFLARYGWKLVDEKDPGQLERTYFTDDGGHLLARVSAAHCLVTAEKVR